MPKVPMEFHTRMTAVIAGELSLSAAIAGEPSPLRIELFEIGEILCRLRLGDAPMMSARQAGLLHDAIDHGVDLFMAGMTPETDQDRVATLFMEAAFAQGDAGELALRLSAIRDGMSEDPWPEKAPS